MIKRGGVAVEEEEEEGGGQDLPSWNSAGCELWGNVPCAFSRSLFPPNKGSGKLSFLSFSMIELDSRRQKKENRARKQSRGPSASPLKKTEQWRGMGLPSKPNETNLRRLAFMKLGPCLRNSVVSPKSGHPIVPGGRPRRRLYRTSFHRSRRPLAASSMRTAPSNARSSAISVLRFDEEVVVPRGGSILVEEKLCCFCWVGRRGAPFYRRQRAAHHTTPLFCFYLILSIKKILQEALTIS
jgi:hypothetical protein